MAKAKQTIEIKRKNIRILEFCVCLNGIRSYTVISITDVQDYIQTGSMSMTDLPTSRKVTTKGPVMLATQFQIQNEEIK